MRMRTSLLRLVCGTLTWRALGPASAAQLGPGVEEVQRCIEANLPERTASTSSRSACAGA